MSTSSGGGRCRHSFDSTRFDSKSSAKLKQKAAHTHAQLTASMCAAPLILILARLQVSATFSIYDISITELAALNDASASVNMTNFARAKSMGRTSQFDRLADTLWRKSLKTRSQYWSILYIYIVIFYSFWIVYHIETFIFLYLKCIFIHNRAGLVDTLCRLWRIFQATILHVYIYLLYYVFVHVPLYFNYIAGATKDNLSYDLKSI